MIKINTEFFLMERKRSYVCRFFKGKFIFIKNLLKRQLTDHGARMLTNVFSEIYDVNNVIFYISSEGEPDIWH